MTASVTHTKVSTVPPTADPDLVSSDDWNDDHVVTISAADIAAAPDNVDYLVGTASAGLSGEIVVGASPGGELGGTWASPTVDSTHSGSTHAATQAAAEATAAGALSGHAAAADPHSGYVLESVMDAAGDIYVGTGDNAVAKLTKGATGTFLQAGASTVAYADVFIPITFSKQGTVVVTTDSTALRWYNDTGRTLTIAAIRATATTAPTGATLIVDVNVDGVTVMTGTKVVIAISGNTVKQTTFSTTTIADGHYLTVNVDQVGSTVAGSDLTVVAWLKG